MIVFDEVSVETPSESFWDAYGEISHVVIGQSRITASGLLGGQGVFPNVGDQIDTPEGSVWVESVEISANAYAGIPRVTIRGLRVTATPAAPGVTLLPIPPRVTVPVEIKEAEPTFGMARRRIAL